MFVYAYAVQHIFLLHYSLCVYGGGDRKQQIQVINRGVEIVIGKADCMRSDGI